MNVINRYRAASSFFLPDLLALTTTAAPGAVDDNDSAFPEDRYVPKTTRNARDPTMAHAARSDQHRIILRGYLNTQAVH